MKRIIALVLCLMAVVSACMAEEMPAGVYTGRIKMYGKIPEKTMETVFSGYMVPDSEKVFADNSAWSKDPVIFNGEGWDVIPDPEILDNERTRACREIAETLLETVYPEGEMELIAAMTCRDYIERDFERWDFWDPDNGIILEKLCRRDWRRFWKRCREPAGKDGKESKNLTRML